MMFVEKYRPTKFGDIVGNPDEIRRLQALVDSGTIPHLLFYGPAGTGKTSCALIIKAKLSKATFTVLNASDDRGIDVVRRKIKDYASTLPAAGEYKILFLDEADNLTKDAQQALRRTMEKYQTTCKFILSGNDLHKIIEPIRSRCTEFYFAPISKEAMFTKLDWICKREGISIELKALRRLVKNSSGDMRAALNSLEKFKALNKLITITDVERRMENDSVATILNAVFNKKYDIARATVYDAVRENGTTPKQLILSLHSAILRAKMTPERKGKMIHQLAITDWIITQGGDKALQLDALIYRLCGDIND